MKCPKCNNEGYITYLEDGKHYAVENCKECNRWLRWVKKPENEKIRTKTSKYDLKDICDYYKIKEPYCFFCLRKQNQLGKRQLLEIEHIWELDIGGEDELHNIQIYCTACHKLKDWSRRYHNWHYE